MTTLSSIIKRDLTNMGKFLLIGAIMLLAISIVTAFILYDLGRVQDGQETHDITPTLVVYLSLFNVVPELAHAAGPDRRSQGVKPRRFMETSSC